MMAATSSQVRRRAFSLLELMLVLPVLVGICILGYSATLTHLNTARTIATQEHRQSTIKGVLQHMRQDLSITTAISLGEFAASAPHEMSLEEKQAAHEAAGDHRQILRVDYVSAAIVLDTAGGQRIVYQIEENAPLYLHPDSSTMAAEPSVQMLVRRGADGTEKRWPLHGMRISLRPRADTTRQLDVRFEDGARFETGNEMHYVYETVLRAGGRR